MERPMSFIIKTLKRMDVEERLQVSRLDIIGTQLAPNSPFNHLQARLNTFRNWPACHIVRPQALAEAGFIYRNDRDRVQCVFCRGGVHNWLQGDTAMGEHSRHYPYCPYVNAVYQNEDTESTQARSGDMLCKVCMDTDIECLFLPCRHVVCCERCSYLITKCAVCRTDIGAVLKVFLS